MSLENMTILTILRGKIRNVNCVFFKNLETKTIENSWKDKY